MKIIILILSILIIVLINITTTTNALTPTYHGCITEKAKTRYNVPVPIINNLKIHK